MSSAASTNGSDATAAVPSSSCSSACTAPVSLSWLRSLPKVEMHAHLSGSVKEETIRDMLAEEAAQHSSAAAAAAAPPPSLSSFVSGDRTLSQCFEVFALLHRLLCSLSALERVTRDVIRDFAEDNVVYLELRTTPRALPGGPDGSGAATKREYVQRVVDTIRECQNSIRTASGEPIVVRLLLSIDRSGSLEDAESTLALAAEFSKHPDPIVVGLDFSGNPTKKSFKDFHPLFERARQEHGLKSTIHVGEKEGDEEDLDLVLFHFRPERIGHVVCLAPRHVEHLLTRPLPIEICPTSNLKTRIVQQLEQHPFGVWRQGKGKEGEAGRESSPTSYPLVVCTDDSGVFNVTLSSELHSLATAFHLDQHQLLQLETSALEHAFVGEEVKAQLRAVFERFRVREQQRVRRASIDAAPTQEIAAAFAAADTRPIAILTCVGCEESKASDYSLLAAFAEQGVAAVHVVWNDPAVQWENYRAAIIRSTWDYHESAQNVSLFLSTLRRIEAAGLPLLNSAETVEWNHSKRYLRELAEQHSIPTVDTIWVDSTLTAEDSRLALVKQIRVRGWQDCVIKPQVSAGGFLTIRFSMQAEGVEKEEKADSDPSSSSVSSSLTSPSPTSVHTGLSICAASDVSGWMVQPFCGEVLTEGEFAFVFLNGAYSHCILSRPSAALVADGSAVDESTAKAAVGQNNFMVQPCHGGRNTYQSPSADLLQQAERILKATHYGRNSLYARVDCLRRGERLLVTELELIEPMLYGTGVKDFDHTLANAIQKRVDQFYAEAKEKQQQ